MKVGRNDPCPCGSGRKYKQCCWEIDQEIEAMGGMEEMEEMPQLPVGNELRAMLEATGGAAPAPTHT